MTYKLAILFIVALLLTGCATKPYVVEFYPPETQAEKARGYGAYKTLDYRKPHGACTILGLSIF